MRWSTPNLSAGFQRLRGLVVPKQDSPSSERLEAIRRSMIEALGEQGSCVYPMVARRIRLAIDAQSLWYVRGDLMAALARMHGEALARQQINRLTALFEDLLPPSLAPRSRSLAG